jgi:hypothetical protein
MCEGESVVTTSIILGECTGIAGLIVRGGIAGLAMLLCVFVGSLTGYVLMMAYLKITRGPR